MQRIAESGLQIFGFLLMSLLWFPGGTIFMALMHHRLNEPDAWDWVLSVVIPGYGLIAGLIYA